MHVCIGMCLFNKISPSAHTICIYCIRLRFLHNEYQLDYTIYISFLFGLRRFYDVYQFQVANVLIIPFIFIISSLLKWPILSSSLPNLPTTTSRLTPVIYALHPFATSETCSCWWITGGKGSIPTSRNCARCCKSSGFSPCANRGA